MRGLKTQLINFCRDFLRYQATSPYKGVLWLQQKQKAI